MFNKILLTLSIFALISLLDAKEVKKFQFDAPQSIYNSNVKGQTVEVNYSKYVSPNATRV